MRAFQQQCPVRSGPMISVDVPLCPARSGPAWSGPIPTRRTWGPGKQEPILELCRARRGMGELEPTEAHSQFPSQPATPSSPSVAGGSSSIRRRSERLNPFAPPAAAVTTPRQSMEQPVPVAPMVVAAGASTEQQELFRRPTNPPALASTMAAVSGPSQALPEAQRPTSAGTAGAHTTPAPGGAALTLPVSSDSSATVDLESPLAPALEFGLVQNFKTPVKTARLEQSTSEMIRGSGGSLLLPVAKSHIYVPPSRSLTIPSAMEACHPARMPTPLRRNLFAEDSHRHDTPTRVSSYRREQVQKALPGGGSCPGAMPRTPSPVRMTLKGMRAGGHTESSPAVGYQVTGCPPTSCYPLPLSMALAGGGPLPKGSGGLSSRTWLANASSVSANTAGADGALREKAAVRACCGGGGLPEAPIIDRPDGGGGRLSPDGGAGRLPASATIDEPEATVALQAHTSSPRDTLPAQGSKPLVPIVPVPIVQDIALLSVKGGLDGTSASRDGIISPGAPFNITLPVPDVEAADVQIRGEGVVLPCSMYEPETERLRRPPQLPESSAAVLPAASTVVVAPDACASSLGETVAATGNDTNWSQDMARFIAWSEVSSAKMFLQALQTLRTDRPSTPDPADDVDVRLKAQVTDAHQPTFVGASAHVVDDSTFDPLLPSWLSTVQVPEDEDDDVPGVLDAAGGALTNVDVLDAGGGDCSEIDHVSPPSLPSLPPLPRPPHSRPPPSPPPERADINPDCVCVDADAWSAGAYACAPADVAAGVGSLRRGGSST